MAPDQLLEGGAAREGAERVEAEVSGAGPSTVWREDNYRAERVTEAKTYESADKGKHRVNTGMGENEKRDNMFIGVSMQAAS